MYIVKVKKNKKKQAVTQISQNNVRLTGTFLYALQEQNGEKHNL
jgi:hypothetical protein